MRLDQYLFGQGLVPSRERAKAMIMAGIVYVNGDKADKAGTLVHEGASIEIRGNDLPYVSRGGLKLEKALRVFPVELADKVCMDVGASTGGFTDCMLQNGARKVYSVDVGYGQLAWKLRCDERVVNMERTNIRHLPSEAVTEPLDFFTADVSFISLKHVFPVMEPLVGKEAYGLCLVKPQFEAGREKVGKKGVVREAETHLQVILTVSAYAVQNGFSALAVDYSPVRGPEGNIEFLLLVQRSDMPEGLEEEAAVSAVHTAHASFQKGGEA